MKRIEHKVGDRVVALTNPENERGQPRRKGSIYVVRHTMFCKSCGNQKINIGEHSTYSSSLCHCGYSEPSEMLHWTFSYLFAPLDNLETAISEAEHNEDYELAQTLTEIVQQELIYSIKP